MKFADSREHTPENRRNAAKTVSDDRNQFNPMVQLANSYQNVELAARIHGKDKGYMWEAQGIAMTKQPLGTIGSGLIMAGIGDAEPLTKGVLITLGSALVTASNSIQVDPTTGERHMELTDQAAIESAITIVSSLIGGSEAFKGLTAAQKAVWAGLEAAYRSGFRYDEEGRSQGWSLESRRGDMHGEKALINAGVATLTAAVGGQMSDKAKTMYSARDAAKFGRIAPGVFSTATSVFTEYGKRQVYGREHSGFDRMMTAGPEALGGMLSMVVGTGIDMWSLNRSRNKIADELIKYGDDYDTAQDKTNKLAMDALLAYVGGRREEYITELELDLAIAEMTADDNEEEFGDPDRKYGRTDLTNRIQAVLIGENAKKYGGAYWWTIHEELGKGPLTNERMAEILKKHGVDISQVDPAMMYANIKAMNERYVAGAVKEAMAAPDVQRNMVIIRRMFDNGGRNGAHGGEGMPALEELLNHSNRYVRQVARQIEDNLNSAEAKAARELDEKLGDYVRAFEERERREAEINKYREAHREASRPLQRSIVGEQARRVREQILISRLGKDGYERYKKEYLPTVLKERSWSNIVSKMEDRITEYHLDIRRVGAFFETAWDAATSDSDWDSAWESNTAQIDADERNFRINQQTNLDFKLAGKSYAVQAGILEADDWARTQGGALVELGLLAVETAVGAGVGRIFGAARAFMGSFRAIGEAGWSAGRLAGIDGRIAAEALSSNRGIASAATNAAVPQKVFGAADDLSWRQLPGIETLGPRTPALNEIPGLTLSARKELYRQHSSLIQSLKASPDGVVIPRGQLSSRTMAELTQISGREVGLFRVPGRGRVLALGSRNSVKAPSGAGRIIAHTHTSGRLHLSFYATRANVEGKMATVFRGDVPYMMTHSPGQRSTTLIGPSGATHRAHLQPYFDQFFLYKGHYP